MSVVSNRVDVPLGGQARDSVPAHLIPAVCGHDLEHVERIGGLFAHPMCECMVVHERGGVAAPGSQPGGLCIGDGVEEADGDAVEV
jgi:hypothetical protein